MSRLFKLQASSFKPQARRKRHVEPDAPHTAMIAVLEQIFRSDSDTVILANMIDDEGKRKRMCQRNEYEVSPLWADVRSLAHSPPRKIRESSPLPPSKRSGRQKRNMLRFG
jgi:hypothetical protein